MIPYLVRLLDITINNATIPSDWKIAIVVPVYKGGDRSLVANYRPVSLTSVVCKRMEHVRASYLRKLWDKKDWLFEGQHGFRPGYSCESQEITVCLDISDALDNGGRLDAVIIDSSKASDLVPHDRLLTKIAASGVDWRVVVWVREFLLGRTQNQSSRAIVGGRQSNARSATRECIWSTAVLAYVNGIWRDTGSTVRLLADGCIIYRKIINNKDTEKLQIDLRGLGGVGG
jgi:hypothetical protein